LQPCNNGIVRQHGRRGLGLHHRADAVAHRLSAHRLAARGAGDGRGEEVLQLQQATRRGEVLVGGDAADRALVQLHRVRHVAQDQRAEELDAVAEEGVLPAHDLGRDLDDGVAALLQALHQPVGGLQLLGTKERAALSFSDTVARAAKPRLTSTRGIVSGLSSSSQSPSGPARISTSGSSACIGCSSPSRRLGVEPPQLGHHLGEVLGVHLAGRHQAAHVAPGQQVEVVEQALHAGVPSAQLAQLDLQAFAQVPAEHAHRLEALHRLAHALHRRRLAAQPRRQRPGIQGQPPRGLHHGQQGRGDQPVLPGVEAEADLFRQALAQVGRGGGHVLDRGQVALEVAAAAAAYAGCQASPVSTTLE
jgi:hypothetical protein